MDCPHCKKELDLPSYAWHNVGGYQQSAVVVTECCKKPIRLSPRMTYVATPYIGDKTQDDWGTPIKTKPAPSTFTDEHGVMTLV